MTARVVRQSTIGAATFVYSIPTQSFLSPAQMKFAENLSLPLSGLFRPARPWPLA